MRIVLIAMMVALLAVPAHARGKKDSGAQQQNSEQKTKAHAQEEKDYKAALSRIPNQKPVDPWATVR